MEIVQEAVTVQTGVAERNWGYRGEIRGTGRRFSRQKWKLGVSGKTNKSKKLSFCGYQGIHKLNYIVYFPVGANCEVLSPHNSSFHIGKILLNESAASLS